MPLDGHSYLVSQGWSGNGTGLRQGAISRPLAIPQKKTLSGLGKDRDEAFPFWDHLFTVAASTIKIKVDSDDEDNSRESLLPTDLKRTSTGILSNRRPATGRALIDSGSTTPEVEASRYSLLSNAKREAAKRGLYSRFFRGPILGPAGDEFEGHCQSSTTFASEHKSTASGSAVQNKRSEECPEERKERKRLRKERKEAKLLRKQTRRARKAQRLRNETEEKGETSPCKQSGRERGEDIHALSDETIHKRKKKRKERTDKGPHTGSKSAVEREIQSSATVEDATATTSSVHKRKRKREALV